MRRLIVSCLLALGFVAGCGDDDSSKDEEKQTPGSAATSPTQQSSAAGSLPFSEVEDFSVDYFEKATEQEIAFCPEPSWEAKASNQKAALDAATRAFDAEDVKILFCGKGSLAISYVVYESPEAAKKALADDAAGQNQILPHLLAGNTLVVNTMPPGITYIEALQKECGCGEAGGGRQQTPGESNPTP